MSRDAVRLHEKGIITYRTTRASSSKPNLSIVALSENNILAEEELSRFNRVSTNIYDIILSNKRGSKSRRKSCTKLFIFYFRNGF